MGDEAEVLLLSLSKKVLCFQESEDDRAIRHEKWGDDKGDSLLPHNGHICWVKVLVILCNKTFKIEIG